MKAFKWILCFAMVAGSNLLSADECGSCSTNRCNPCNMCEWGYTAHADLLYWDVRRTDLEYLNDAISGEGETYINKYKFINPGYNYAYRFALNMYCDCWDVIIRWTSYKNSDSNRNYHGNKLSYDIDYDVYDAEFGYLCYFSCPDFSFKPFLGVKLAWIDEEQELGGNSREKHEHSMEAYGLYLGFETRWIFCDSYALVVRGNWGIMDAEIDNDTKLTTASSSTTEKRKGEDAYINYDNVFVGLDISLDSWLGRKCNIYDVSFLVGWEMENWKSLKRFNDRDDSANLGLGGLVARFTLNF